MKSLALIFSVFALSATAAVAQDLSGNANRPAASGTTAGADITGFRSPATLGPGPTTSTPDLHPVLKPKLGGVFVDGAKYGTILISPTAPASYGMGEKYLSAPDPRYDLERETGRAAHHEAGGIKLFSLEF
jgi:hypothetical protein